MLDSNLLRCFLAVLEHRKLTTAANELCVTQPALSKSLRRLEEELGVPLFQRTPAGMVPTTYGITLGRRARLIHLESLSARTELQMLRDGGFGSLIIGIGPLWSGFALPEVISELVKHQSKTHIKVISGVLDTLLPQLLKGELDVVCAALDFPDHPDLEKEYLLDAEHVIVGHESHPLASIPRVTPEDLLEYPFIGFADDYAGVGRMEKFFASHGLHSPGLSVETSSLEMLLSLLATGGFLASFSTQILDRSRQMGLCRINLSESFWRFRVGAVYRRGAQLSPLVGILLRALQLKLKETSEKSLHS